MAAGGDIEIRYSSWYVCQALARVKEENEALGLLLQCYQDMRDYRSAMGPIPERFQGLWDTLEAEFGGRP